MIPTFCVVPSCVRLNLVTSSQPSVGMAKLMKTELACPKVNVKQTVREQSPQTCIHSADMAYRIHSQYSISNCIGGSNKFNSKYYASVIVQRQANLKVR
jgi:hypothetical protein